MRAAGPIEASKPLPFRGGVGVGPVGDRGAIRTSPTPDPSPEGEGRSGRRSGSRRSIRSKSAVLAGLVLLAACHKPSFDERYAKAEKEIRDRETSIDKELADRASEAAVGGGEFATGMPKDRVCPSVTNGWLDYGPSKGDLFVFWLLEVRRDGSISWDNERVTQAQLVSRLQDAGREMSSALLIKLEAGANCDQVRIVRDEVERHFNCKTHRCTEAAKVSHDDVDMAT